MSQRESVKGDPHVLPPKKPRTPVPKTRTPVYLTDDHLFCIMFRVIAAGPPPIGPAGVTAL